MWGNRFVSRTRGMGKIDKKLISKATSLDFASDVESAVEFLKTRKEVDIKILINSNPELYDR